LEVKRAAELDPRLFFGWHRTVGISPGLLSESHSRELLFEALAFCGIWGFRKLVCQCEKSFLLGVFGLKAGLDQIDEHAVGAGFARFGDCANAICDRAGNCDAEADRFPRFCHAVYFTPFRTRVHRNIRPRLRDRNTKWRPSFNPILMIFLALY
jgi:hypothetical protein